jgi:hypothetical protein
MLFKNSVRTAKKTQYFTVTKINRLTLFKEIIAVYCENSVRTAKKTPYFIVTKINRLTLFKEIIAVYCENHKMYTDTKRTGLWMAKYAISLN